MNPPLGWYEMSTWSNVSLGPFTATSSSMTLILEAEALDQTSIGAYDGCDIALDGIYLEGINLPPDATDAIVDMRELTIM